MRPDGVGPRSATASCDGASNVAETIFTASAPPARLLQTISASSASVAADTAFALSATAAPTSNAHRFAFFRVIVSTLAFPIFVSDGWPHSMQPSPFRQSLALAFLQNDPSALPRAITATSASSEVTMPTMTMSK
ncbi:hypothetical protein ACVWXQ_006925 [Bradyrhizobium sp. S3.14.4]